jgi:magnesium transporter
MVGLLIIMRIPVKSNDVKLPFHTIPVGVVLKVKFVTISFHKTNAFLIL